MSRVPRCQASGRELHRNAGTKREQNFSMGRKHASQIAAVEKNRLSDVAARTARAGEEVWQLRKDGRVLTCALRNDDGVEVDVQLLEGGELLVSRRCPRD